MPSELTWIVVPIFGAYLIYLVHLWGKDLLFYRNNGWDFTVDSGHQMYHGEDGAMTPGRLMSNRYRVLFGMPMMILIFLVVICGVIFIPEQGFKWELP